MFLKIFCLALLWLPGLKAHDGREKEGLPIQKKLTTSVSCPSFYEDEQPINEQTKINSKKIIIPLFNDSKGSSLSTAGQEKFHLQNYFFILHKIEKIVYPCVAQKVGASIDRRQSLPWFNTNQIYFDGRVILSFLSSLDKNNEPIEGHYTAGFSTPLGFKPIIFFATKNRDNIFKELSKRLTLLALDPNHTHFQLVCIKNEDCIYQFPSFIFLRSQNKYVLNTTSSLSPIFREKHAYLEEKNVKKIYDSLKPYGT